MMSIYVTSFKQFNKPPIKFQTRFKLQFANMLFRSGGRPAYNFTRWRRRKNCVDWNEKWCICVVYNRADSDCAENVDTQAFWEIAIFVCVQISCVC